MIFYCQSFIFNLFGREEDSGPENFYKLLLEDCW